VPCQSGTGARGDEVPKESENVQERTAGIRGDVNKEFRAQISYLKDELATAKEKLDQMERVKKQLLDSIFGQETQIFKLGLYSEELRINEIPTVPIYYPAKPQPRERAWHGEG
jgi:hypothetical protein